MNTRELADAEQDGFTFFSGWRKQPTQVTGGGIWFDLSMSPGNPRPNNYVGPAAAFTALSQSKDGGVPHGQPVAPKTKYLQIIEAQTSVAAATPLPMMILDYLGFYPFIDQSDTDEQVLDNTNSLTRYADGEGVMIMPIVTAPQVGGTAGFRVRYTNSKGVPNRLTTRHAITTQAINGTIVSSAGANPQTSAPFMRLQYGDTGVRKIDGFMVDGVGDIGLMALVLVKVIAEHYIRGIDAPCERNLFNDDGMLPIIKDDAYLNLICLPSGSLSGAPILGYIRTIWA
ncbi:MAG: hypothetical protein ACRCWF_18935 [Beijerinckiaceae bacterium]